MKPLKIACVGDIMFGDSFYNIGHGTASSLRKYGIEFLPKNITEFLSEHNVVLGNVECVLSDKGKKKHLLRSMHMRGVPDAAKFLSNWSLTIANVANNHILEHGLNTAIDTVCNLESAGIKTIGAGANKQFQNGLQIEEMILNGKSLAFIGVCLRDEKYAFNGGADIGTVINATKELSKKGKLVCISIHWGNEYIDRPDMHQKQLAHNLVDAGATLIIGHHPHVFQGIEEYKGAIIAYSLGNFIFGSFLPDCCWSIILSIEVTDNNKITYNKIPIVKDSDHRPSLAVGSRKVDIENEISRRYELISFMESTGNHQSDYKSEYQQLNNFARQKLRKYLKNNFWKMNPVYWPQILLRPIQRRLGRW